MKSTNGANVGQIDMNTIVVDYSWNIRSGKFWLEGATLDPHGLGYQGFKADIEARGQMDPVIARIVELGDGKFELRLVDGHRRFHAITALYEAGLKVPGLKPGHILCSVMELTELEAVELNASSNAQREGNTEPDIARAAHRMWKMGSAMATVSKVINKDLALTKEYVTVYENLSPRITDAWRDRTDLDGERGGLGVTFSEMVGMAERCPRELHEKCYTDLYYAHARRRPVKNHRPDAAVAKRHRQRCEKLGKDYAVMLTMAEKAGAIEIRNPAMSDEFWRSAVERKGTGWTDARAAEMAQAARDAFLVTRSRSVTMASHPAL